VGNLKGYQKKHLKGLAHGMKPLVFIGQKGLTPTVVEAVDEQLETHELIKLKFIDFKEKDQKEIIIRDVEKETGSELVGMVGHIATFYRQHPDTAKQKIKLPER